MRAVWSFWSKPFQARQGRAWREPLHHLLAWGLSLQLARKYYPETVLVTDTPGKALLVDRLGLPFTHVSTELDRLRKADVALWSLGKLIAYSLQDRPFLHLDTDVFLWKPLPAALAAAPVFAQCPEEYSSLDPWCGPRILEDAFTRHRLNLPDEWVWARSRWGNRFHEANTGIVGGTRWDFLRHYAALSLDLALQPQNSPAWADISDRDSMNQMIEQVVLSAAVEYHRFHPDSPYRGISMRYLFPSLDDAFDPAQAARAGFTHLLGDAKSSASVVRRLEQRVQREDMSFYQHCQRVSRHLQPVTAGA